MTPSEMMSHPLYWVITGIVLYIMVDKLYGKHIRRFVTGHWDNIVFGVGITVIILDMAIIPVMTFLVLSMPLMKMDLAITIGAPLLILIGVWTFMMYHCVFKLITEGIHYKSQATEGAT